MPAAPMGRLLARRAVVAGVGTRPVLGRPASPEPQRHAMGSGPAGAGLVPADRAGQRVEAASRLVRQECHDLLLRHKADLFSHLMARWRDLFNANFDVLLYDLTSTYYEINASEVAEGDKR